MIQLLLCWRYLRTRWIALASIVSVTLGVATLVVVNSVMDGFTEEMQNRIHGILSDVVVESHTSAGISRPDIFAQQIRRVVGDKLEGITTVVTVPAMLTYDIDGQPQTQQINLIGIDSESYASVSDFSRYLMHPENQKRIDFQLKEDGYDRFRPSLPESGWKHRRRWAQFKKEFDQQLQKQQQLQQRLTSIEDPIGAERLASEERAGAEIDSSLSLGGELAGLPPIAPPPENSTVVNPKSNEAFDPSAAPSLVAQSPRLRTFDPETETRTGIVLGIGLTSIRYRDPEGELRDHYFIRPGDDVSVSLPGLGTPPRAVSEQFTVVDMYESKMSEYDATFAFVPIERLQQLRGMIDPSTSIAAVNSLQIKLKPGVKSDEVRDTLRTLFPPETAMVHINTWRDQQGPLLAAVQMETTILNLLLFMIIAVAGFGILATFYMIVVEKTRDIGVLKSLGASGGKVAGIFLAYGLLLGSVGSGVGAILGLMFVKHINDIAAGLERLTGRDVFDPTVYYFTEIPTIVRPEMVVWVVCGSIAIAIAASVLPSMRAARMHPVEALRYE